MSDAGCSCAGGCSTCADRAPRPAVADPIVFRQGAIKSRLLSRIGAVEIQGRRPLAGLGTRDDDDPAIALIDAFAGALHVLAWNAARLSDDGSIRRTEDRDALVDLVRLLGYEPRPALAATTTLAFTVDAIPGLPEVVTISQGTKVASVPGQDEQPQTFETDADLEARAEWNELRPLQKATVPGVTVTTTSVTVGGTSTTARPGDLVLAYLNPGIAEGHWLGAQVAGVTRDAAADPPRTRIDLVSPVPINLPEGSDLEGSSFKNQVIVLGQRAAAFGATAPDLSLMSDEVREGQLPANSPDDAELPTEWLELKMFPGEIVGQGSFVDLDGVYADAVGLRAVLFRRTEGGTTTTALGRIVSARELNRKGFGLATKVSRIELTGIGLSGFVDKVRETAIYLETGRETLLVEDADVELPAPDDDRITVQGTVAIPVGRRIVFSGDEWTTGHHLAEVVTLKSSNPLPGGDTELVFERSIAGRFHSTTLTLHANAVGASHGETPVSGPELIGSGSTANLSPSFLLKRPRLSYVPASDPRGYAPAIEVRVSGRRYAETSTLFGRGTGDLAYTVKTAREEDSVVQFAGRLASGAHNVTALYRTGGGRAGNLAEGRLTTLMTPALGVGKVDNPVPADGASDAETIEDLRSAAPRSIRTLDRVVSLADFEAFARTRRGVGKVVATGLHDGPRSVVCLTIANTELQSPVAGSEVFDSLRDALDAFTVPGRRVRIEGFTDVTAELTVALVVDPTYRRPDVEAAVRTVLGREFGRAARSFGESLHRSAVLAALHRVDGVVAGRLTWFALPGGPPESEGRLLCPGPKIVDGQFRRSGLLSIVPDQLKFEEMLP